MLKFKSQNELPKGVDKLYIWPNKPPFKSSCIQIWKKAFSLGLTKNIGWDISKLSPQQQKIYLTAAAHYMRGVYCYNNKLICPFPKKQKGFIKFYQDSPPLTSSSLTIIDKKLKKNWDFPKFSNLLFVDVSEKIKSFSFVNYLIQIWENNKKPKKITAIGGGVLSDVVGFTCSLLQIDYEIIPTTLLSAVDASIGGKTAINFSPYGKNMLGSFYLPQKVSIWNGWFNSLKEEQIYEGAAECLKHILLLQDLELLKNVSNSLQEKKFFELYKRLPLLLEVKTKIVNKDPFDLGNRKLLNLGHTLAHGLESLSQQQRTNHISHGQAVAIGLIFSLLLSKQKKIVEDYFADSAINLICNCGCLISRERFDNFFIYKDPQDLWEKLDIFLKRDKKNTCSSRISWVLLNTKNSQDFIHYFKKDLLYSSFVKLLKIIERK
jgi:3-dehydroquinate synthetase